MRHNLALAGTNTAPGFSPKIYKEINKNCHQVFHFMGPSLTGAKEVELLEAEGVKVSGFAKQCFTYPNKKGYDARHQLQQQWYSAVLMPAYDLPEDQDCTLHNLKSWGISHYGYSRPLASFIVKVSQIISHEEMMRSKIDYFYGHHYPLLTPDRKVNTLFLHHQNKDLENKNLLETDPEKKQRRMSAHLYVPYSRIGRTGMVVFSATPIQHFL